MALVMAGIVLLLLNVLRMQQQTRDDKTVLGLRESVRLVTPGGQEERITAKIDTGADLSSIDIDLARRLGFTPDLGPKKIKTSEGEKLRNTVKLTYILSGRRIETIATVETRSGMSNLMIIGKEDLKGFIVDPSVEFLTEGPDQKP